MSRNEPARLYRANIRGGDPLDMYVVASCMADAEDKLEARLSTRQYISSIELVTGAVVI